MAGLAGESAIHLLIPALHLMFLMGVIRCAEKPRPGQHQESYRTRHCLVPLIYGMTRLDLWLQGARLAIGFLRQGIHVNLRPHDLSNGYARPHPATAEALLI